MASQVITSEQVLEMSELERLHAAVRHLENTPDKDIFPKKYATGVEHVAIQNTCKYFEQNPNMPLKEVVVAILMNFKVDLSSELLLNITQKIVQKWESLSQTVHQMDKELEVV